MFLLKFHRKKSKKGTNETQILKYNKGIVVELNVNVEWIAKFRIDIKTPT